MVSSSSRAESSHLRAVTAWLWPVLAQESGLGKQLGPLPLQQLAEVLSGAPSPGQQPPTEVYTMEGVPAKALSEEEALFKKPNPRILHVFIQPIA